MVGNTIAKAGKRTLARRALMLFFAMGLGVAGVVSIKEIVEPVTTFYGVDFSAGEVSFADTIVSYEPIIYLNDERNSNVRQPFNNPVSALGEPNSTDRKHLFASLSDRHDVSLGFGGSIILRFTNNALTGSGDTEADLWIFEAGETTESVFVEISKDGKNWQAVGRTDNQRNGIDIDAFGWGPEDYFAYVRLTDDPEQGEHDGMWSNGEWVGWGGADIDSVGAVSSVSLISSVSNSSSLSMSPSRLILLVIAILASGVGMGYLVNTLRLDKKNSKQNY